MTSIETMSKIGSFRHKSTDLTDNGYAEQVYRTIVSPDGAVKETYMPYLEKLLIAVDEILDK
jgi:hypothetical protein